MKFIPAAYELIANMREFFQLSDPKLNYLNEEPLRAELFSSEQMERFGKALAHSHNLSSKPAKDHLLKRLAKNEHILNEVRKLLTDSIKRNYQITPAGEWLIDNFYLIEEHVRNAKAHFPKDYSEDLPQLAGGKSAGQTRVYDIALQIISHSDGRIDIQSLSGFVKAYQTVTNLQLGELWAIPIMLRLGLIENLRRVSARIAIDRVDGNLADYWSRQMIETAEKDPKNLILVVADMARSNPPMGSAFVSELSRQLRGRGPDLALALNWIEQQLSEIGLTRAELISAEIQKQAADQVSVSNSIASLRLLGAMDWHDFVEKHSVVEQTLREDDGGVYGLMDFSTRDRYRHVVEYISKKSKLTEYEVARIVVKQMQDNAQGAEPDERKSHVGYYLIGEGVEEIKRLAKTRISIGERIRTSLKKSALLIYLGLIFSITVLLGTGILLIALSETKNLPLLIVVGILSLICSSQLSIAVINFFSTLFVKPHILPRMDFSHTIPQDSRTLIVIPVILTSTAEIDELLESLEVRFLANRDDNLFFGLLTDFCDADKEILPGDSEILNKATEGIEKLNKKYGRENNDLFFLFHRPRHWNLKQNLWMGYERKRGKLSELNSLLRGKGKERFSVVIGDQSVFPSIKYVITLDADTQLPLDTAWKLVGTMAHPLNKAWYDPKKKRVTKGYGILQPRVTVSLPDTTASIYARMHGNEPGIDPYTKASSDVYQDLFSEGSFIGKGIYDLDVFINVLHGRFAENCILSHDLLEGCYVRAGLLSDVQLFEKYPGTYRADLKRRSRWVRGDWQIFPWFLPFVPDEKRHWQKNPLSLLSKWKIFDNIRRSLVPVALTGFLLLGWFAFSFSLLWTILVSAIIVTPIFITSVWNTIKKPKDVILMHHIKNSIHNIGDVTAKTLFALISLPFEAFLNFIAISRTLWRMLISRKKMLEWNPSANDELFDQKSLAGSFSFMWPEPFLALLVLIFIEYFFPEKNAFVLPIISLWIIAPLITWWISRPMKKQVTVLSYEQTLFLRKLARKTWSFFEQFVVEKDNWLPPDNFQEQPVSQIAHRTSLTNIGLSLLSTGVAHDFGYVSTDVFIDRTNKTIGTLNKMERYRGHFFNWYDTQTLNPLFPKYVSTVDSGNLVASLILLKQKIISIHHKEFNGSTIFTGFHDTLLVFLDTLEEKQSALFNTFRKNVESVCRISPLPQDEIKKQLDLLEKQFISISEKINYETERESKWWANKLEEHLKMSRESILIYEPWVLLNNVPEKYAELFITKINLTLTELLKTAEEFQSKINGVTNENSAPQETEWLQLFRSALTVTIQKAEAQVRMLESLENSCNELSDLEWNFLYDRSRNLFSIGYNVQEHHTDASYYDLLASEARICSFIGIAQGKLPGESWFVLGRLLTNVNGNSILLSWSGSMFEYLMPLLFMPAYENTLLDQTYKAAVKWQIEYGKQTGLPWGISESGYNMLNANFDYQYRAFGAPGLGLKRGLEEDAVVAPYASALALMVTPDQACENLQSLSQKGLQGKYGMYEAVDYTPSRLQRGQSNAIIYSYMAHHQGMSLLSFAYLLLDKPLQKLFEAEPQFKAVQLLLQERIPQASTYYAHTTDIAEINYTTGGNESRVINTPNTSIPQVQLLSNGRYHVMVTNAGGGYSRWKDFAVTRWREDGTSDNWGTFCYIHDLQNNTFWSNTFQPSLKTPDNYEAVFSQGRVDFRVKKNELETHTVIVVSPEDDIEIRRITITNNSTVRRKIQVTSYAEVVIAHPASDLMQPAFNNLFVQTEIVPLQHAIICTRRPRSAEEFPPWLFHLLIAHGKQVENISYETDRMKFIGRGNSIINPQEVKNAGLLSGNQGSVLDPVVSIRYELMLEPEEVVTLDLVIGITETKDACQNLIDKYQDKHHLDRVFELSWTHSQVVLRQINATEADAQLYGRLASFVLFANSSFRAEPSILINNHRGQSGLWGYSVSGDLPIVLLKIEKHTNMQLIRQMIQAHAYWRLKGLIVDLIIWNEEHNVYRQNFQNEIEVLIPVEMKDKPGGIFARVSDHMSNEDRILFQTVARVIISDNGGTLAEHIKSKKQPKAVIPFIQPAQKYPVVSKSISEPKGLLFYNGFGGFSSDGKEYVISVQRKNYTPVPWVNVIANPNFGTVISESGTAYSWVENAHELRLTPWNNDPVCDSGGEVFYLRDEEKGNFWSPTPLPVESQSPYIVRHGFGYSSFEHIEDGIYSEMKVYVDIHSSVKFTVIKIQNQSGRPRKLSATGYVEWVLGDNRIKTAMHTRTEIDPESGALFAKNTYNTEFQSCVAFFDADFSKRTFTADRTEFIGRNGSLRNPDAMHRQKLSGRVGLALDPCAAIQVTFDLAEGEEREIVFRLGAGKDQDDASELARHFRGSVVARDSFEKAKNYWRHTISTLQVETPDTALNIISNGWLTYQTLSSRLWGRSGYYQSGGAFGFRDQLQDILSLLHAAPEFARDQILLSASRQFKEGDVQHWWHPPFGRGVRTRCSDDFLWLPFVTTTYVNHTGDFKILEEQVSFLEGRLLNPGEESYYDLPVISATKATLYEHCVLAIKHALVFGENGLPLIGTGDWNDGYDKIGKDGKGESVWLAFFLYDILTEFENIAALQKDIPFAGECKKQAVVLKDNIHKNAWDGKWYKRAWFDDGTPIGSSSNEECKIDSIAQSWSVLSGAGEKENAITAMESAYEKLVFKDSKIIKLLDPPFDKSDLNPGYIKGYVPGVRENGGQYTHAAIWLIMAFAEMGENKRVWELLDMINPVNLSKTAEAISIYKVEPYVLAADVYANVQHNGRGGWTWYTGSAGWMYRLIIEYFLGLKQAGNKLSFAPRIPEEWESFKMSYCFKTTTYNITVKQLKTAGEMSITDNGVLQEDKTITLENDGVEHTVEVVYYSKK
jgi:cyclic beta-1,2-glucan synthetase